MQPSGLMLVILCFITKHFFYPLLLLLLTGKHPKQYMFLTIHGVHCIKRYGRLGRQQNTSEFGAFAGGHTTKNNYFWMSIHITYIGWYSGLCFWSSWHVHCTNRVVYRYMHLTISRLKPLAFVATWSFWSLRSQYLQYWHLKGSALKLKQV